MLVSPNETTTKNKDKLILFTALKINYDIS